MGEGTEYPVTPEMTQRLLNNFTYHKPFGDQPQRYVTLRDAAKALATMVVGLTPPGREQSLAITKIEEAIFWANAAIARGEVAPVEAPAAPDQPPAQGAS